MVGESKKTKGGKGLEIREHLKPIDTYEGLYISEAASYKVFVYEIKTLKQ